MLCINSFLRHALLIQVEIEFLVIILPPREFRFDKYLFNASMRKQYFFQLIGPCVEFIIIITVHLDTIRTCAFTNVITESLILQAIYIPATAPQFRNFTYQICFQCIRKTAMLIFFLKINLNIPSTCIIHRSMKLLDLLKTTKISLYTLHQCIHLLQRTSIWQVGIGIKHNFLITTKITTFVHFLNEQPETSA